MIKRSRTQKSRQSKRSAALHALSLVFLTALYPMMSRANPSGANVINGNVSIDDSISGVLNITNSPNAIINWQDFSIAPNEVTRFIQQHSQSAVLNRVVGQNPSQILGQLLSNGRVFVINPNGVVFGANARIDTQGLLASSLNLSNDNFLSGNFHFVAGSESGGIRNEGIIHTGTGGNIVLIAPHIENNGVIQSDGGKIVLAAGEQLTLTSMDDPEISYQVQAPENSVLNVGQLLSQGGAIDLFAGTITHSGEINANSVEVDEQGNIHLLASADIHLSEESLTLADNTSTYGQAGDIHIESNEGTAWIQGDISASAINQGKGGEIHLLGERVGLLDRATVSAEGDQGGGKVLVGGDYQGTNLEIKNAQATYVSQSAQISANAVNDGDGGKVIVWSDGATRMHGEITATGGVNSGDGGLIETSGHYLEIGNHVPDAHAFNGLPGTWLLDPSNIEITTVQRNIFQQNISGTEVFGPDQPDLTTTIDVNNINTALDEGSHVVITTNDQDNAGGDVGNITVNAEIKKSDDPQGQITRLGLEAHNDITVNADISSAIGTLEIRFVADKDNSGSGQTFINANIDTNGGDIFTDDIAGNGSGILSFLGDSVIDSRLTTKELTVSTGVVTLNDRVTTGILNLSGGTISGSGDISLGNASTFNFSGGILGGSGILTTSSGATSQIDGSFMELEDSRIWNNSGVINWTGGSGTRDLIDLIDTSQLNNLADGTINDTTDATDFARIGLVGASQFNNAGTYNKLGNSTNRIQAFLFDQSGTVNLTAGTWQILSEGTDSGTYNINGGRLAYWTNSGRLLDNTTFSGDGAIEILNNSGVTIPTGSTISHTNITLQGGRFEGSGTLVLPDQGILNWESGWIRDITFNSLTGSTVNANANDIGLLGNGIWNNTGTINWNGDGGISDIFHVNGVGAEFNNLPGGIFNDNTVTSSFSRIGPTIVGLFNNLGIYNKLGDSVTITDVPFNHSGTMNISAGTFQHHTDGTDSGTYNITGTLEYAEGNRTLDGTTISGTGDILFSGGTTSISTDITISHSDITMTGGTLNGDGTLAIPDQGTLNWNGGTITGTGILDSQTGSTVNLNGDTVSLGGDWVWNNSGTINWNGNGGTSDVFRISNAVFNNLADGIFNDNTVTTSFSQIGLDKTGQFNNLGIYNKLGDTTTLTAAPFNHSGTMNISAGTWQHHTDGTDSGIYNITGTLEYAEDSRSLSGATFSGTGDILFSGGSTTIPTDVTISHSDITMTGGTLNSDGTLAILDQQVFNWNAGTISGNGMLDSQTGSTVNIDGNVVTLADSHIWNNTGTINWNGDGGFSDIIQLQDNSQFNNLVGGVFNDDTATTGTAQIGSGASALFTNAGTYNKLSDSATQTIITPFNQSGILNVNAGTWQHRTDGSDSGIYNLTGALEYFAGDRTLDGTTFSGSGDLLFSGGSITIPTDVTISHSDITMTGGTLNGDGTLAILDQQVFNWNGGTISGAGLLDSQTGSTVNIDGNTVNIADSRVWNNTGTINWNGDGGISDIIRLQNNSQFNNLVGGVFNDNTVTTGTAQIGSSASALFSNAGIYNKLGDAITQTTITPFNQGGTMNINAGSFEFNSISNSPGDFDIAADSTLSFNEVTTLAHPGNIKGAGNIQFNDSVTFDGLQDALSNEATTFTVDAGPLQIASFTQPPGGTLIDNDDGTLTYTADTGFSGLDTFTLNILDSFGKPTTSGIITLDVDQIEFTWSGGIDGLWSDPANWGGAIPTNGSDVTIPDQITDITITFDESAGTLFLNTLQANESLTISGGNLTLGDNLSDSSVFALGTELSIDGGIFGGDGTTDINGGFNWSGGELSGSGFLNTTNATSFNLNGTNNLILNGLNLLANNFALNTGSFDLQSGELLANAITLDLGTSTSFTGGNIVSQDLTIEGDLSWSAGSVIITNDFHIGSGSLVDLQGNVALTVSPLGSAVNQGTLQQSLGTGTTTFNTPTFVNTGTVLAQSGTLLLGSNLMQNSGTLELDSGTISTTSFVLNGGQVIGTGTLRGDVDNNDAIISPGFSIGSITIDGNYTQSAEGTLLVELAGLDTSQFDRLIINGNATLGGQLVVTALSPYADIALAGDDFNIISAQSLNGNFNNISAPSPFSYSGSSTGPATALTDYLLTTVSSPTQSTDDQQIVNIHETEVVALNEELEINDPLSQFLALAEPESEQASAIEEQEEERKEDSAEKSLAKVEDVLDDSTKKKPEVCE